MKIRPDRKEASLPANDAFSTEPEPVSCRAREVGQGLDFGSSNLQDAALVNRLVRRPSAPRLFDSGRMRGA